MRTDAEPPPGYGYGHVEGREKYHLVKLDPFNSIAVCGKYLRHESVVDRGGVERNVCSDCLRIRKADGH